jgi:hypothetical protein
MKLLFGNKAVGVDFQRSFETIGGEAVRRVSFKSQARVFELLAIDRDISFDIFEARSGSTSSPTTAGRWSTGASTIARTAAGERAIRASGPTLWRAVGKNPSSWRATSSAFVLSRLHGLPGFLGEGNIDFHDVIVFVNGIPEVVGFILIRGSLCVLAKYEGKRKRYGGKNCKSH